MCPTSLSGLRFPCWEAELLQQAKQDKHEKAKAAKTPMWMETDTESEDEKPDTLMQNICAKILCALCRLIHVCTSTRTECYQACSKNVGSGSQQRRVKKPSWSLYAGGACPKTTERCLPATPLLKPATKSSASGTSVSDPKNVE